MSYTVGSLFAGIGGFDLGFERAGFTTSWQVEIDPYCQKVLAKNFPHAARFGDIRECGSHNLKPVDVICGGFPCQDISVAGLGKGIDGERSGLWSEFARIIHEIRPTYVVVENVAALLGRGISRVLGDLAEVGYDAEWECVSAADVGAPHLRERIWILAYPKKLSERKPSNSTESVTASGKAWNEPSDRGEYVANPERVRELQPQGGKQDERRWPSNRSEEFPNTHFVQAIRSSISRGECGDWCPEPNVGRVAHGVPKRVDRLRGLGNAVVPQIPEMIARRIKQALDSQ